VFDQLLKNFTKAEDKYEITVIVIHQPAMAGGSHFQRYCIHIKPDDKVTLQVQEKLDDKPKVFTSNEEM